MAEIRNKIIALKSFMDSQIIGQEDLVNKLIITLLADGNALVEGAPGLAKTKAIKTLASAIKAKYNRIQFTPDLLPSEPLSRCCLRRRILPAVKFMSLRKVSLSFEKVRFLPI